MNFMFLPVTLALLLACVASASSSYEQTNEGSEFYVGFFQNRFGLVSEAEKYPPVLWITTKESTRVKFTVSTIHGPIFKGFAKRHKITYVNISLGMIVYDSTQSNTTEWFKGIHIKTKNGKKIVVFGQHEELASNDAYLALPVVTFPGRRSHEYIVASINGGSGNVSETKDSVALIVGTEDDTEIVIKPSINIPNGFAPATTDYQFVPGAPDSLNTITIQRFQTFYLQVRGGDISSTRIIANKPISVFSGHECANVPFRSKPCDMLIEQIPPIHTWGYEVVTIPLKTKKKGDIIKVIASQDATRVNVVRTNTDDGTVTEDHFILNAGQYKELFNIKDFSLIQSNHPIEVFQFGTSYENDNVIMSDPLMLLVPPREQYLNSYAVATAPFEPSLTGTVSGRVAYVNYTNIAVPAESFNPSLLIVNNKTVNPSDFKPIRRADKSIWGYGAQLSLDKGAQVIQHQNPNAVLSVTLYGFSNQQSWGCAGGMGLAPIAVHVKFSQSIYSTKESSGRLQGTLVSSYPLQKVYFITLTCISGSATKGTDFDGANIRVRFDPGMTTANFAVQITKDTLFEGMEAFTIRISETHSSEQPNIEIGDPNIATGIIINDEGECDDEHGDVIKVFCIICIVVTFIITCIFTTLVTYCITSLCYKCSSKQKKPSKIKSTTNPMYGCVSKSNGSSTENSDTCTTEESPETPSDDTDSVNACPSIQTDQTHEREGTEV